MRIVTFPIPGQIEGLKDLLNSDECEVKKMLMYGENTDNLLVFCKTKEETLNDEGARLEKVKEVAETIIQEDLIYSELKNANQRCLYLLDNYYIPKSIALDVIDEVKVLEIAKRWR